ncbi:MAG: LuxR family transcriptional regulator, partial [Lachnoanaerobaculum saburreum]
MTEKEDKNRSETIRQKLSLYEILRGINRQSRSMRSKLMVYLCCLVLSGTGILLMMLVASGVFSESGRQIEQNLQVHLQNQKRDIKERMDLFTINGIDLSKRLTTYIEREVLSYPYDIKELENDEAGLRTMQENMYLLLEGKMHVTRASGVYAVFDTTVNTSAPNAKHSRSGVYLRLANISGNVLEDDVFLFRGNPNVAMQNKIQIHNRWNMEFDTEDMYWFDNQISTNNTKSPTEKYLWINRVHLKDTWENSMFLSVPVIGSEGGRYGICGLEISGLLFRLSYPKFESKYGDMVTIIAPVDQGKLLLSKGLSGSQGNSYINENDDLFIDTGKVYN